MLTARAHARRRRVVIVGGGFAGFHAARALSRLANGLGVEVVLINPTDYSLYLPLLPEVAAGILDPRRVSVPLVATLPGVRLVRGRLVVDEHLTVPGHPEVFACGDAAAVPDLTRPGRLTPMTAQHAQRQGTQAAANLAASLGHGHRRAYRHHDLGFVVDLGGAKAAANPLGVPLSGLPAKAVTRGYHLAAIPANRARIAADWLLDALLPRQTVQLGLVRGPAVPLGRAAGAAGGGAGSQARTR